MNTQTSPNIDLRWLVSFPASCLHAAAAIARGQLIADSRMAEAVTEPAQELRRAITAAGLPKSQLWRNLVGLSSRVDGSGQLAELAALKTVGAERAELIASQLGGPILAIETAVRKAFPTLVDELASQVRPLRERWESRGMMLLHGVARWTDPRLIAPSADIVVVHPSLGGGGTAHLPFNNVHFEAVMDDPVKEIPEILRLAWLLAQLNLDLPIFCDRVNGNRLPHIAELAMLPVTLRVAEEMGDPVLDEARIALALRTWNVVTPADVDEVDILWRWWGTYAETRPPWPIALTALDRMFG